MPSFSCTVVSHFTTAVVPTPTTWGILLAKGNNKKEIILCLRSCTHLSYCADIKSQHLQNISICSFCGKGDFFSNLLSQAPLKQPHKATASKFLLLNSNLHTTKLLSSQRLGGAVLFNLNPSVQLSRNSLNMWVQETGKKKLKSSNCCYDVIRYLKHFTKEMKKKGKGLMLLSFGQGPLEQMTVSSTEINFCIQSESRNGLFLSSFWNFYFG